MIDREYVDVTIKNIDDYVSDRIAEGSKARKPGFGTGLNWTYASGSKAKKCSLKDDLLKPRNFSLGFFD